jgi:hypothetical protein
MTITVVTVRDEIGAPSAREVFRGGDGYTIASGNLEIISSARKALGFYPSGNWLSVYVGDCVTVNPDRSKPELSGGFGPAPDATEPARHVNEPGENAADAEILVLPQPDPHRTPRSGAHGSTPQTTRPPGMRPVVFRAKAYKPEEREPEPPPRDRRMQPVVFPAKAYKAKEPEPEPPPHHRWMRPIIFRPRTYAPEQDDPPTPRPDQ